MSAIILLVADGRNVGVYNDLPTVSWRWPEKAEKEAKRLRKSGKHERINLYRVRVHDQEEF